jgi:hypothetical protein
VQHGPNIVKWDVLEIMDSQTDVGIRFIQAVNYVFDSGVIRFPRPNQHLIRIGAVVNSDIGGNLPDRRIDSPSVAAMDGINLHCGGCLWTFVNHLIHQQCNFFMIGGSRPNDNLSRYGSQEYLHIAPRKR